MKKHTTEPEIPPIEQEAGEYRPFTVTWEINIDAHSAKEAAKIALDSILNGTAKVFTVLDEERKQVEDIDLHKWDKQ